MEVPEKELRARLVVGRGTMGIGAGVGGGEQ